MRTETTKSKLYKKFSRLIVAMISLFVKEPIDEKLIMDLRQKITSLKKKTKRKQNKSDWQDNERILSSYILNNNPVNFLQSDVVRNSMFACNAPSTLKEYFYLKKHNWNRWKGAIEERNIFPREPFIFFTKTTPNSIHHAYHLANLENTIKNKIEKSSLILEFGGGYGNMSRIIHNLNFKGKYIIFDLPEFSALQSFYLKAYGIGGVNYISAISQLKKALRSTKKFGSKIFIATWSLSECPTSLRNKILPIMECFDVIFLAYQSTFYEIDNIKYFNNLKSTMNTHKWVQNEITQIPDNFYLFGKKWQNKNSQH